jgi:hypothetical protein
MNTSEFEDSDDNDNIDNKTEETELNASTELPQSSLALSQKKKKKKKRRCKRQRRNRKSSETEKKHVGVRFGSVHVREHERCLGLDGVPLEGGWPLGISPTITREYEATLNEFEEMRQEELRERWRQVMEKHWKQNEKEHSTTTSKTVVVVTPPPPTEYLETRQYDYRKRVDEMTQSTKNPLFGPLPEEDRMMLLVSHDDSADDTTTTATTANSAKQQGQGRTRARSNSMHSGTTNDNTNSNSNNNNNNNNKRHNRMTTRGRGRANSEQLYDDSEHYSSTHVMHIQHSLEQVRIHRTLEGSVGCTCRKLDVYIPPPAPHDGGEGKKKAPQHRRRRMKPLKVIEELRKRGKLPPNHYSSNNMSRSELEQLLHDVVEEEPCCWGDECSCRREGIGCQADACSCWLESHQPRKGRNNHHRGGGGMQEENDLLSVTRIRERCGNNMYCVDVDRIHEFRRGYCCQEIVDESSGAADNDNNGKSS